MNRPQFLFKKYSIYTPYCFKYNFATELSKVTNISESQINFLLGKLPEGTLKHYLKRDIPTMYKAIKQLKFSTNFLPGKKQVFKKS
jgi:hypothetical protein